MPTKRNLRELPGVVVGTDDFAHIRFEWSPAEVPVEFRGFLADLGADLSEAA